MALVFVPSHVDETMDPADNPGVVRIVFVAYLVLASTFGGLRAWIRFRWRSSSGWSAPRERGRHDGVALADRVGAVCGGPAWRRRRPTSSVNLGGSIMQSILDALSSRPAYASPLAQTIAGAPTADGRAVSDSVATQLQKSFAGAAGAAHRCPEHASEIVEAARDVRVGPSDAVDGVGILAIALGAGLVFFLFPR